MAVVSRPLRVAFPGAFYHLTCRGNNREMVFLDEDDFESFCVVLEQVVDRFGFRVHGYCVMGNHYHLLAETPLGNVSRGMRQLNGVFTQRYNRRHGRVGHLFQARFSSVLVEDDSHLLEAIRYLAWNPPEAGRCEHPAEYEWGSYRVLLGLAPAPAFLTTELVLGRFGEDRATARERLRRFVEDGGPRPLPLLAGVYACSEEFLRVRVDGRRPIAEVARREWQPLPPRLDEIFASELSPVSVAYCRYGYTLAEIANYLGCHYSTVSRRLAREETAGRRGAA